MALIDAGGTLQRLAGCQTNLGGDLGLPQVFASSVAASGVFAVGTPGVVIVLGQTASGTSVCKLAIAAASSSVGAAFSTAAASSTVTFNSTSVQAAFAQTDTTNVWVGVQLTDGGSGSTFAGKTLTCFVLYITQLGENWSTLVSGYLATASTVRGDGQGYLSSWPQYQ